jgi:alpha-glucuronidase
MASTGLNGIIINNVNADSNILNSTNIAGMKRVADAMRPYGVQIGASMNFAAPMLLGNLSTFDPLVPSVINFWQQKAAAIYAAIPDFAGYLIKANSEGQPGPLTYNRTLVQGANMFADTLKPYGGLLMFRAFVYNLVDYSDWTADRAKAAQELVGIYNGQYRDNVIIQAKYGYDHFPSNIQHSKCSIN